MSSYLQNNEYQTYNVAPYQLPGQQIAQAVQTRNAYWDQGASQLKNAYQNLLGLDLTHSQNKEKLDTLMQQANNGLKQAVQSDLALGPNVADAMKIFDPIVKDSNIMGDHAITQHYQSQLSDAQRYKTKGTGSEYSQTNVNYVMQGLDEFAKDDPSNWQSHYTQRKFYTPYYDTAKEDRELLKNFKPSITSSTFPDVEPNTIQDPNDPSKQIANPKAGQHRSDYLISRTDKSSEEAQLRAYLSANHSDKYKEQMGINGSVAYYGNEGILKRDYSDYNNHKVGVLNDQAALLSGRLKTASEDSKVLINKRLSDIQNSIVEINQETAKANTDGSFLKRNRDRIAGNLFLDSNNAALAAGNQRIDQAVTYKPDQVAITHFVQEHEDNRLVYKLTEQEKENELNRQLKLSLKFGQGNLTGPIPGTPRLQQENDDANKTLGGDYLNNKLQGALDNRTTASHNLTEKLISHVQQTTDPTFSLAKLNQMPQAQVNGMVSQFAHDNPNDPVYQQYLTADRIYRSQKVANDALRAEALASIDPNEKVILNNSLGDSGKPLTISKSDNYRIFSKEGPRIDAPGYVPNTQYFIELNGKTIPLTGADYEKIRTSGTNTKINNLLNATVTSVKNEQTLDVNQQKDPRVIALREGFATQIGIDQNEAKNINIYAMDKDGFYFSIPPGIDEGKLGISKKQLETQVAAQNGKVVQRDGRNVYFIPNTALTGYHPSVLSDPEMAPYQDYFDIKKGGKQNGSVAAPLEMTYDPNKIGEYFSFNMDLLNGVPSYKVYHIGSKTFIGDPSKGNVIGFENLESASLFIRNTFKTKKDVIDKMPTFKNWK